MPSLPWWPVVTVAVLTAAFAIALGAGRTVEAVIIGVFLGFEVALVAFWLLAARRPER